MRQLVFEAPRRLSWRDAPLPVLEGPGEALVRPLAVARCDLDWCQRYQGTLFDFDRYRRPEVYTRITAQRGVIKPV